MFSSIDASRWPGEYRAVKELSEELLRLSHNHQVVCERKVLGWDKWEQEYRLVVVEWGQEGRVGSRYGTRTVLLESADVAQVESCLHMLVSEAKVQVAEAHDRMRAYASKVTQPKPKP